MKYVLMGIGNELNGDDGVGNTLAREFVERGWLAIPCETVPENFVSVIEREKPEVLVMVDAAEMDIEPGDFRVVREERLDSEGFGTHGMPLSHLVSNLGRHAGIIIFVGIQPGKTRLGDVVSPVVEDGKKRLMDILRRKDWGNIKKLE